MKGGKNSPGKERGEEKSRDDLKGKEESPGKSSPKKLTEILAVLEGLFRKAIQGARSLFRGKEDVSVLKDIKEAFSHLNLRHKTVRFALLGLIFLIYLLSGVYTLQPGEQAVVKIFGKEVQRQITEGLHYHLPWPIETVEKVNMMKIRRVGIGVQLAEEAPLFPTGKAKKAEVLTGDENIIEIKMVIQYRIKDASDYLFNVYGPDKLITDAAKTAITIMFGKMRVDDLLTTSKSQIQRMIGVETQRILDDYRTGIYIANVNLQEVNPPEETAQAFRDVSSAKEEREEKINKAMGYYNSVIPEARGKAYQMISDAEGYKEEVINRAKGEAQKFIQMLEEYRKAERVTEYRLYLETMEKVLVKVKNFIVDSRKEKVNLKFIK